MKVRVSLIALFAVLLAIPIYAHHGTGVSYDASKSFTVKATVTEFRYANPHPQIYFDVKNEQGEIEHWTGEIAPNPVQLVQDGWGRKRSEAALAPGTEVTMTIAPSRAGTKVALVQKIVNSKGEEILSRASQPAAGGEGQPRQ